MKARGGAEGYRAFFGLGRGALALAVMLTGAGCSRSLVGKKMPAFELKDLRGKAVKSDAQRGKVLVLNFWATWAPPCRLMLPELACLQRKFAKRGVVVLAVAVGEDAGQVAKFMRMAPVNFTVLLGGSETEQDYFGRGGLQVPMTLIVDGGGVVVESLVGYHECTELTQCLDRVLAKAEKDK